MTAISMFDHRAILCSIRVINLRCDILVDRLIGTHGFSRCRHNKLAIHSVLFTHRLLGSFQSLTALTIAFLKRVSLAK